MNAHLPPHILHLTILPVDSILPYPHYQVSHTPYVRDPPPVPSLATFGLEFRLCRYQSVSIAMLFPLFLMRSLGLTGLLYSPATAQRPQADSLAYVS